MKPLNLLVVTDFVSMFGVFLVFCLVLKVCVCLYISYLFYFVFIYTQIRMSPHRACSFIVASVVLHNIAILRKEPIVEEAEDDVLQDIQPQAEQYEGQQDGRRIREYFARNFFS